MVTQIKKYILPLTFGVAMVVAVAVPFINQGDLGILEQSGLSEIEEVRTEEGRTYYEGTRELDGKQIEVAVEDGEIIGSYGDMVDYRKNLEVSD